MVILPNQGYVGIRRGVVVGGRLKKHKPNIVPSLAVNGLTLGESRGTVPRASLNGRLLGNSLFTTKKRQNIKFIK